ncbi:hypothetical protein Wcon_00167 [Wolbachia endosymbiont of Cylisticus convexus]|nr:hypothetical protein Wcon_00167 [Wolbachia endosymbiont of Cylisticus convexus]
MLLKITILKSITETVLSTTHLFTLKSMKKLIRYYPLIFEQYMKSFHNVISNQRAF